MDLVSEIQSRLQHDQGCERPGIDWETDQPNDDTKTVRVSADCKGCDASIFDVEFRRLEDEAADELQDR